LQSLKSLKALINVEREREKKREKVVSIKRSKELGR